MHGGAEFRTVRRDQCGAAVDAVIVPLGIDHDRFAELPRAVDDGADDARRQHALGIIGQHHRAALRQRRFGMGDNCGLACGACRLCRLPIRPHQMRRMVLGDEAHFSGGMPPRLDNEMGNDRAFELGQGVGQSPRRVVLAGKTDENAACAERRDIARDIAGAADLDFAARHRKHRRRRLRRNARDLAVDEVIKHQVADAEHRLLCDQLEGFFEIEHVCCRVSSRSCSAIAVGAIEIAIHVTLHRRLERREVGIIAGAPQIGGLGLREILVAVAERNRHVDIFDRRLAA